MPTMQDPDSKDIVSPAREAMTDAPGQPWAPATADMNRGARQSKLPTQERLSLVERSLPKRSRDQSINGDLPRQTSDSQDDVLSRNDPEPPDSWVAPVATEIDLVELSRPPADEPLRAQAAVQDNFNMRPSQLLLGQAPVTGTEEYLLVSATSSQADTSSFPSSIETSSTLPESTPASSSGSGWLGLLGAAALLAGAAGGSKGSAESTTSPTPVPPPTGLAATLTGVLMAGPMIKPLLVSAFDAKGKLLDAKFTDSTGRYTLSIDKTVQFQGGVVLLQVTDPDTSTKKDYIDEATGQYVDVTDLRALTYVDPAQTDVTLTAQITTLTTLAAERLAPLSSQPKTPWTLPASVSAADVALVNKQVAALFGLASGADVTLLEPKSVILSNGLTNTDSNAYGKALAVLSYAQSANPQLNARALAQALQQGTSSGASLTPLNFNTTVADALRVASLQAVQSTGHYLNLQDAYAIQQSTAGSPTRAVDFRFLSTEVDLGTQDPSAALGQQVYRVTPLTNSGASSVVGGLVQVNTGAVRFALTGRDASAFILDATTGALMLRATETAAQAKGGKGYEITLNALADVFGTPDNPADDVATSQTIRLQVVDTTAPAAPATPVITLRRALVGRPDATSAAGLLDVWDDLSKLEPGVRHDVVLTLTNATDSAGRTTVTRNWTASPDKQRISLTSDELTRLGDGKILVRVQVKAVDAADNSPTPVVQTTEFQLDTTVTTPRAAMLTNVAPLGSALPVSGDGKVRIYDIEPNAQWVYAIDGGAEVSGTNTTLDLAYLGSGPHEIAVRQTDVLGNVSATARVAFQLELASPTGIDAQISQFNFYSADDLQMLVGTDTRLFHLLGIDQPFKVSGMVRGSLGTNKLQVGVNGANWQTIQLDGDLASTGWATWSYQPLLANGAGTLSLRLLDVYQHSTVLTSRSYIYQDDTVLPPPTPVWRGVATIDAQSGLITSLVRASVNDLRAHAVAQYQLASQPNTPLLESDWRNDIPRPLSDGIYYLFVRQLDLLTGKASGVADPLVINLDTQAPPAIASTREGLYFYPVDDPDGKGLLDTQALSDITLIENTSFSRARTVVVRQAWTDLDIGATLTLRWGHVLTTYRLTAEDVAMGTAYVQWSQADIQNQPGWVTLQAWMTDLAGNTSAVASRQWQVKLDPVDAPRVLGWYTRTNGSDTAALDTDNTLNQAEVSQGVVLQIQLPLRQSDGSALSWSNNSQGFAFKLSLLLKSPSQAWRADAQTVTTRSFKLSDMDAQGVVQWTLPTSLWSGLEGVQQLKVLVQNNAYASTSALRLSETTLTELVVDTSAPSAISLSVTPDGQRSVALGVAQPELPVTVSYSGMAAGDVLVFQSQLPSGVGMEAMRYVLQARDITTAQDVGTTTIQIPRQAITQGRGDGVYELSVAVSDLAGNRAAGSGASKASVMVDTVAPAAPTLSIVSGQDMFLNAMEDAIDITVTWPGGVRSATDRVQWVLGGKDLTSATLQSATVSSATYRIMKADLGAEGLKDLRAQLVDASGNSGAFSAALTVQLDSQPHDPPVLGLNPADGNQRFLKAGAIMLLDIRSPQMVAGDILQLQLVNASADPATPRVPWGAPMVVTQAQAVTLSLIQADSMANRGLASLSSGTYLVTATLTDLAGNVSRVSSPYQLVIDLEAPTNQISVGSVQLSHHAIIDATAEAGHRRAYITREANQRVTAQLDQALQTAAHPMGAEYVFGRILSPGMDADAGWVDLTAFVSDRTLNWDLSTYGGLLEGARMIQLQLRDQAGNRGALLEQAYVLDRTAPDNVVVSGSVRFSQDTAPVGMSESSLGRDLLTRLAAQTITLNLARPLTQDPVTSSTLGAGQEHLWASLDDGAHWLDVSDRVDATGRMSWTGVTLTGASVLRFKVTDVAGNAGTEFNQAYALDITPPLAAILQARFLADTGVDAASKQDFVTAEAITSINLNFNQSLSNGDRVYVRMGSDQAPLDITEALRDQGLFLNQVFANVEGFRLLTGAQTLSMWVEDQVGNVGRVFEQRYVYAPQAPALDLDGANVASTTWRNSVSTPMAQHGLSLGREIHVQDLPAGVADIVVSVVSPGNDNGSNERLLITPGIDVNLNGVGASSFASGFLMEGVSGAVQLKPWGGSELHFTKLDAVGGSRAYFTAAEVSSLLSGLRYFNTAEAGSILSGDRAFDISLTDRAGNVSAVQTTHLLLESGTPVAGRDATSGTDRLIGTAGDDILLGLRGDDTLIGGPGNDVLWGGGGHTNAADAQTGNNVFIWQAGDASSATRPLQATDVIRDFRAWNGSSGDRLDITALLQGYSASQFAGLGQWVQVDNQAVVQGVAGSTRITIDVNGAQSGGALQLIELQGVSLSSNVAQDLVNSQLLKVL